MIVAAGLSPAWQQILRFEELRIGEVNRAVEAHWCASGKVLNVGIALAQLQADSLTLSSVGGATGELIDRDLESLQVRRRLLRCETTTRVCTTLLDQHLQQTTELVENAAPLTAEELAQFEQLFADQAAQAQTVVLTGSLPAGAGADYYAQLMSRVPAANYILDFRGPELLQTLELAPLLIKPNREELQKTLTADCSTEEKLLDCMRQLTSLGAQWVLVSRGAQPAVLVSATEAYRISSLRLPAVNPIACGDCLAAGVAVAVEQGATVPEAVRYGVATAAENVRHILPARVTRQAVEQLLPNVTLEPLN